MHFLPAYLTHVTRFFFLPAFMLFIVKISHAQEGTTDKIDSIYHAKNYTALKFRNIGPAMMSGRVSDIAIDPVDENTWYIAMGSSGVWKTSNAGVTFTPIFDEQKSFSIGCVAIHPNNRFEVWVGTGENVGGRHVGIGDGVYKSEDGGNSWKSMGLKNSEHISKIVFHPTERNTLWVAAQGPLWSKGGERGIYKSVDGGNTWQRTLGDDEWVGATDLVIDPREPDQLYAATWQRHRTVAAYMGGGPGSALHKSEDGGITWKQLKKGLPSSNLGKIGLAISPQKPDELYAAIELDRRKGGVYKSFDRGESWIKQSDAVGGATGPHYYQEIWASPHQYDRIYLADNRMQVSIDGGKTFERMKNKHKHVDNHAVAFRKDDPDYVLVGCDGGVYETFDQEENWRFMPHLPTLQFYKVAVDDAQPFYSIYGGTQDNNSLGGPSRTDNVHGIRNADWYVTLFADGHQSAIEPGNPDIMYAEWQEGNLVRVDRTTGQLVYIQPQPRKGDPSQRFNWDAPILVSPHNPMRLYFASQRVWRSDNRGDSWEPISEDLTRDEDPLEISIMGRTQSWDNAWDMYAMSNYNTITSLAESPLKEGLIYAGTDDGIIQVTDDGGNSWKKIEVGSLPDCPSTAFVNDIKADLFDVSTVYVALDNHKYGDYKPYLYVSNNKGNSWKAITGDLPNGGMVWRLVQDHVDADLFFLGTEYGVYFSPDRGEHWIQLKRGVPSISFRDLAIQRRENDLVGASFGRGFFVLDDYSSLRNLSKELLEDPVTLFQPRDAWWYIPKMILGGSEKGIQGASYYAAPNPDFGANFSYFVSEIPLTRMAMRQKEEKELNKEKKDIPFPGWDNLEAEKNEMKTELWLVIMNDQDSVIRRIQAPYSKGMNRISWDLKYPPTGLVRPQSIEKQWKSKSSGYLVAPGSYKAVIVQKSQLGVEQLTEPVTFRVKPLYPGALEQISYNEVASYWRKSENLQREMFAFQEALRDVEGTLEAYDLAYFRSQAENAEVYNNILALRREIKEMSRQVNGYSTKNEIGAVNPPTLSQRFWKSQNLLGNNTYGPSDTQREQFELAQAQFDLLNNRLKEIVEVELPQLDKSMQKMGAPAIKGQRNPK
jgi:photosystem II stability/assembly factor-like uncharacterized protein